MNFQNSKKLATFQITRGFLSKKFIQKKYSIDKIPEIAVTKEEFDLISSSRFLK